MESLQQLKAWQEQAESFPPESHANMDVAKRLLRHGMEALSEISRLRKCLKEANEQTEHFEREWYLRGDEIERLRAAIKQTLDENGHLADGDVCTLIVLKRAIE